MLQRTLICNVAKLSLGATVVPNVGFSNDLNSDLDNLDSSELGCRRLASVLLVLYLEEIYLIAEHYAKYNVAHTFAR